MGIRDTWLGLLKDREKARSLGLLEAQNAFNAPRAEALQGLLGQQAQPGVMGELGRFTTQLQAPQQGSGFFGSDRGQDAQTSLYSGMIQSGYKPQEAVGLLSTLAQQQKPTGLMQNLQAAGVDLNTEEGQKTLLDAVMKPSTQVNVGTNMKPPTGYRFANPNDPQNSRIEPIPGGPATRGTGEQQKKIAAFEGIRGMVGAMQEGLKDGVDPNSLSMATTGMLKGVPVMAGIWEGLNGDAKKEATFLNETENFGNTALQIMRGAQVGPAEQVKFEKSLPTKGMTAAQYENALNTSIRIFNDSMRATIGQLGGGQVFNPISGSSLMSPDKASRLDELRRKRNAAQ